MKTGETKHPHPQEGMADALGERAKDYVDAGVDALNAVSEKAGKIRSNARDYVRDNPWLAVGVAAGVGLVIGYLFRAGTNLKRMFLRHNRSTVARSVSKTFGESL